VETGFISNPPEEARLRSAQFQDGAAEALARGVKDFVESRLRIARAP
jgi:N-acetylmuramoyl-L-alanine amidase